MTRLARCRTCKTTISMVWKNPENCYECGGPVDHIDVDMGSRDRLPRLLNIGGIVFVVIGVLFLIFKFIEGNVGRSEGWTIMFIFIIGILLFIASLLFQVQLTQKAKEKAADDQGTRKQRRIRTRTGQKEPEISSGILEDQPRRTASKVLIKRR